MSDESPFPLILMLTVGGSPQPLQTAISETAPDVLLLIASAGEAETRSSKAEADCIKRKFLQDHPNRDAQVREIPADDPNRAFSLTVALIDGLRAKYPTCRIVADYTGGTKSMSAALLMAAFQRDLETRITTGRRDDLIKVSAGTQTARAIDTRLIGVERDLGTALQVASHGDYAAAARLIEDLERLVDRNGLKTPKSVNKRLQQARSWAECLAAWDCFNHGKAMARLEAGLDVGALWAETLKESGHAAILEDLAKGKNEPRPSLCQDLLENARRRQRQGRLDDAVARLYRLTEACVQTQLYLRHRLKSGELNASVLPPELLKEARPSYDPRLKREVCKLGLMQTVRLLKSLDPDDPLAAVFGDRAPPWQFARNNSILAHGYTTVDPKGVKEAFTWVDHKLIPAMGLKPMPPFPDQPIFG